MRMRTKFHFPHTKYKIKNSNFNKNPRLKFTEKH
jgi:hypothetical protein